MSLTYNGMKIAFDASVLGAAYYHANESRTGVFRVAETLWHGLQKSENQGFWAAPFHLGEAQKYLKSPHLHSDATCQWARWELAFYGRFPTNSLAEKVARWAWFQTIRQRQARYTLDPQKLNEMDLYHSPFHPVPAEVRTNKQVKTLVTVHDLIPKIHPEFFGPWHIHNANELLASLNPETFVACVSESTRHDLLNWCPNVSPERVSVIPLAADRLLFYPVQDPEKQQQVRRKYAIPAGVPYFLSVSTLEPRKNLTRTLEAFQLWAKEQGNQDAVLVLVGSMGWKVEALMESIQQDTQLKGRIILTGYVADEDLAALYSGAQVFVYPSLYEGFGLPVLEAMQCGTPVVTSRSSSLPEVVGETGVLVDPLSVASIAEGLQTAWEGAGAQRKAAIERAKDFDWSIFEQAYHMLYQHIHTV